MRDRGCWIEIFFELCFCSWSKRHLSKRHENKTLINHAHAATDRKLGGEERWKYPKYRISCCCPLFESVNMRIIIYEDLAWSWQYLNTFFRGTGCVINCKIFNAFINMNKPVIIPHKSQLFSQILIPPCFILWL